MFLRNDVVSAAMRIEPARAVPNEAPRLVIVFWTPPTSGLCSSGTADTVTAPSCDASAPMPSPISSIGTKTISGPASASNEASSTRVPGKQGRNAETNDQPRRDTRKERGMPSAAASSVSESGRRRTPVSSAREPQRYRQEQRYHEEDAHLHHELEKEHRQAAGQLPVLEHRRLHQRLAVARLEARLPLEEQPDDEQPAAGSTRSRAIGSATKVPPAFGSIHPHYADRSTPRPASRGRPRTAPRRRYRS